MNQIISMDPQHALASHRTSVGRGTRVLEMAAQHLGFVWHIHRCRKLCILHKLSPGCDVTVLHDINVSDVPQQPHY